MDVSASPIGNSSHAPNKTAKDLRQASQDLESLWLSHILKEARPKASSFLGKSFASEMFGDMLDEELAKKMAQSGMTGLSDQMVRQFSPPPSPTAPKTEDKK